MTMSASAQVVPIFSAAFWVLTSISRFNCKICSSRDAICAHRKKKSTRKGATDGLCTALGTSDVLV